MGNEAVKFIPVQGVSIDPKTIHDKAGQPVIIVTSKNDLSKADVDKVNAALDDVKSHPEKYDADVQIPVSGGKVFVIANPKNINVEAWNQTATTINDQTSGLKDQADFLQWLKNFGIGVAVVGGVVLLVAVGIPIVQLARGK
jgi:hypothetical protein